MAPAHFSCHGGATSANKAYPLRSRKDSLGLRHIAQKAAQRRVSKTLAEIAPPNLFRRAAVLGGNIQLDNFYGRYNYISS